LGSASDAEYNDEDADEHSEIEVSGLLLDQKIKKINNLEIIFFNIFDPILIY
jgi:hypothetical protein